MTRTVVNAHAATLPGASVSDLWGGGHDTWKVGGKMFAGVGRFVTAVWWSGKSRGEPRPTRASGMAKARALAARAPDTSFRNQKRKPTFISTEVAFRLMPELLKSLKWLDLTSAPTVNLSFSM